MKMRVLVVAAVTAVVMTLGFGVTVVSADHPSTDTRITTATDDSGADLEAGVVAEAAGRFDT